MDKGYDIEKFPESRIATFDIGRVGMQKHHIKAFVEIDVTDARKMLREKKKTMPELSFNSWLIKCIGAAASENPHIHAMRKGRRSLVLFKDVDISIVIEKEVQGKKVPLPYVIRRTNEKSISEICREIKTGCDQAVENEGNYVLGENKQASFMKLYYLMPGFLRRLIWQIITGNPFIANKTMGSIAVTNVGMMGKINGWVLPVSVHPLCFAVGSIIKKPGVVDDKIEVREYLYLTVLADHDVIDGAPAVRIISKLSKMIESGYGLI